MGTRELNRFVKSDAGAAIKDVQFKLELPLAKFENIYTLPTLHRYVIDQIKRWDSYESLPVELLESKNYFNTINERIDQLVENVRSGNSAQTHIDELNYAISQRSNRMLPADSSEAIFLISIFKESSQLFSAALAFFKGSINYNALSDSEYMQGVIMASMHRIAESPTISRTSHERSSFNALKNRLEKYISESDSDLKELFREGEERINTFVEAIDDMKNSNQDKLNKWFAINQTTAQNFTNEVSEERANIERTYKELLQLQAPAQHWKETSEKLLDEGHMFMRGLFALIIIGGIALYILLWKTPQGMLDSIFNGDSASAIRWSIVFVTFISLFFIGIQALRKAMFSSFHLARDAQEREKLTMYYLSLIKEGAIGNDDKALILQSLFSRADSGLLKEDSSPSMPGMIDKLRNGHL